MLKSRSCSFKICAYIHITISTFFEGYKSYKMRNRFRISENKINPQQVWYQMNVLYL